MSTIWWLAILKRIEKIVQENAFDEKKKRPRLKFNPGLALIDFEQLGPEKYFPDNLFQLQNCIRERIHKLSQYLYIVYWQVQYCKSVTYIVQNSVKCAAFVRIPNVALRNKSYLTINRVCKDFWSKIQDLFQTFSKTILSLSRLKVIK